MEKEKWQEFCQVSGIDWKATLNRFMDNESLYEKILCKFPDDPSFQKLRVALEAANVADAFIYAHTLKGLAGNLGLERLFELLMPFTDELRNGNAQNSGRYMEELEVHYAELCGAIGKIAQRCS
ncbi:MAG: Hpt domain-containing protein [Parabacteroides sp.]|nr:Hpt domain-containing protein [Parabacteroides sp.]